MVISLTSENGFAGDLRMDNSPSIDSTSCTSLVVNVVMKYSLDGEALASLLRLYSNFNVLPGTLGAAGGLMKVEADHSEADLAMQLSVVLLDAGLVGREHDFDVASYLPHSDRRPVLLLDSEVHPRRLSAALKLKLAGYFTRHASIDELVDGIRRLSSGERALDAHTAQYICPGTGRWKLPERKISTLSGKLSARETQVLQLIAMGNSVKECAEILKLSPSTIDNHKSRAMKKLGIHRTSELIRLAIREGLVPL